LSEQLFLPPVQDVRETLMRDVQEACGTRDAALSAVERKFDETTFVSSHFIFQSAAGPRLCEASLLRLAQGDCFDGGGRDCGPVGRNDERALDVRAQLAHVARER